MTDHEKRQQLQKEVFEITQNVPEAVYLVKTELVYVNEEGWSASPGSDAKLAHADLEFEFENETFWLESGQAIRLIEKGLFGSWFRTQKDKREAWRENPRNQDMQVPFDAFLEAH